MTYVLETVNPNLREGFFSLIQKDFFIEKFGKITGYAERMKHKKYFTKKHKFTLKTYNLPTKTGDFKGRVKGNEIIIAITEDDHGRNLSIWAKKTKYLRCIKK